MEEQSELSAEIAEQTVEETVATEAAAQSVVKPKNRKNIGEAFKNYFTATRMAYLAVFTALSFILRLPVFEFPIIPAVPFLK